MKNRRRAIAAATILPLLIAFSACHSRDQHSALMVAAAMSLRNVMPELLRAFHAQQGGTEPVASYASSGSLRQQVEGGAPIDAVVFADAASVDRLIEGKHADPATRRIVASNSLVLIGPRGAGPLTFATVDTIPAGEMLCIGEPASVPVGRYARRAFRNLGKWDALRDRLVFAGHVAAVLNYVRRGEVAAGVVYGTDILGIDDVVVLDRARGEWAPAPEVVAAMVNGARAPASARAFVKFLESPHARTIFQRYGFGIPEAKTIAPTDEAR